MSQTTAIVDKLLTNVSNALVPEGYVSEDLLPVITAKQKTGKLAKYGNNHLRIEHSLVGGRGGYRRVEPITRSSTSYSVESHGLESIVTEDDYSNVELPYKAEEDEVLGLTTQIWLGKEQALADTVLSTALVTQNQTLAGTSQFSDFANSDPLAVFQTARNTVRVGCGLPPNAAVMDWATINVLAYSPQILDALGYSKNRAGQLSEEELAKAMGIERLYVARSVYNSSKEGQSDSLAAVWGKDILFFRAPEKAAPYQTSFGYRVILEGRAPRRVYKYSIDNPPNSTGIIVDDSYDFLISNASAAYLIKAAIA